MTRRSQLRGRNTDAPDTRGGRLQLARNDLGKTQAQMAGLLGVSVRSWQDYESGVAVPKVSVYERLAELGFRPRWLLEGVGPPKGLLPGNEAAAPVDQQQNRDPPPVEPSPRPEVEDEDEDEVEELMRALSFPAEVRLYGTGPVTVQLIMTAAMQYAKERNWSAEKLARLARFSRILEEILEPTHDDRRAPAPGGRDARAG